MKKEMSMDKFLEGLLVMLITAAIALIGNWITSGFVIQFSKAIPGMLILLVIAIAGMFLGDITPIPGVIWITIIGILAAVQGSPTANVVNEYVGQIGLLPLATPVLAFAGVNIGKDWVEFKKIGWRGVVVTLCVMIGTFVGSALIAWGLLEAMGII